MINIIGASLAFLGLVRAAANRYLLLINKVKSHA